MYFGFVRVRFKLSEIFCIVAAACGIFLVSAQDKINVLHLNEFGNEISKQSLKFAQDYTKANGLLVEAMTVDGNYSDLKTFLENICSVYTDAIKDSRPPHIIFDTTRNVALSETVKAFSSALSIPTLSASFGQQNDSQQWRNLDDRKQQYLIQVMPPLDIIPEVVRAIVKELNITNAAILFDDWFVMDHKYKALLQNLPTRHVITAVAKPHAIQDQIKRLQDLDIHNFFILGSYKVIGDVLDSVKDEYFKRNFAWHAITYSADDQPGTICNCKNATVVLVKPNFTVEDALNSSNSTEIPEILEPRITNHFYFDVAVRTFLSVKQMINFGTWPMKMQYLTCDEYDGKNTPEREIDLRSSFMNIAEPATFGNYSFPMLNLAFNGNSFIKFDMSLSKVEVIDGYINSSVSIAKWSSGFNKNLLIVSNETSKLKAAVVYRVKTVVQAPFIMANTSHQKGYSGYCIDLMDLIAKKLDFEYEIEEMSEFGKMDDNGNWNGVIKKLIDKEADIALGTMSVMSERETVIDFTVPFYDLVGITILMKLPRTPSSLFKFLTVLETNVWLCILGSYFFTSILMYIFDRWSPYSYQNNREKYIEDDEKREFNMKECLWFCMTSLTPQGGGEAPKNLSGRLVAATWWLFGFIIIASYTANLAAFLTVSRLDKPIESLEDLAKQYKTLYSSVNGSDASTYFYRMSQIEGRFYEIWKEMSLNDSLSPVERSKLAVWDYPVSDKYTKIWQAMNEATLQPSLEKAVQRVLASKSGSGFAFIGDATDIRYIEMTSCEFIIVGEEFSRKPYAIGVQKGSPLKAAFDSVILNLLNDRELEKLKDNWWRKNLKCEKIEDQADGISIQNIGGVFIVIFIGIGMACLTLIFEYWWYRHRKNSVKIIDVAETIVPDESSTLHDDNVATELRSRNAAVKKSMGSHASKTNSDHFGDYFYTMEEFVEQNSGLKESF